MGVPGSMCGYDGKGGRVNHKKVERIYRDEGLSLRRRARKKATAVPRVALPRPSHPGAVMRWTLCMTGWSMAGGSSV